jgi:undecaprenyl-diphosphatase
VEWLQIITLALLQGLTEFLPISSSAHLILPAALTDWPDQGLAFDVAVHLGTLLAVCGYFRRELLGFAAGSLQALGQRTLNRDAAEVLKLGLATLPVALCGVLFKDVIEDSLRSVTVIALATIVFGLALGLADRRRGSAEEISWLAAGIIGIFQALALIPGTSRSGITITAALLLGLSRTRAARFSFLLSIPTISAAALLMVIDLLESPEAARWSELVAGAAVAGISAYLCIEAFVRLVERTGMMPYVIYRLVLGVMLLTLAGAGFAA